LFLRNFPQLIAENLPVGAKTKPLEFWFEDEARVGKQATLTRVWAQRGFHPRALRDQRYAWAHIFGAVCPARQATAALVLPCARTSCFWVYAYPALLRYAAHSAGGYWARILPQASEIAS
jgi:hypothetical protein